MEIEAYLVVLQYVAMPWNIKAKQGIWANWAAGSLNGGFYIWPFCEGPI
jgi:hypothetical protein